MNGTSSQVVTFLEAEYQDEADKITLTIVDLDSFIQALPTASICFEDSQGRQHIGEKRYLRNIKVKRFYSND